jgi:protein-L-isoaspartate(D-aspartate) O-methyltransferase
MSTDAATLRQQMLTRVRGQVAALGEPVMMALRSVPRHQFIPDVPVDQAYVDDAIIIKRDQQGAPVSSASQPTIMAIMLEQLTVSPGQRVLEIGTGSGYNAALLAHLAGPDGQVFSVDIDADLVSAARTHLAAAGFPFVTVRCADGADGLADHQPFDRIIATVGVWDLAPPWLEQLAPRGRIVVPLDLRGTQVSAAFEKDGDHWTSRSVEPCGFMRLRGASAGPARDLILDPATELMLRVPDDRVINTDALRVALTRAPVAVRHTGISAIGGQFSCDLKLWLSLADARVCDLSDNGATRSPIAHAPVRLPGQVGLAATMGLLDGASVAALVHPSNGDDTNDRAELEAHGFGPHGAYLADELSRHVSDWVTSGRPAAGSLRISAYQVPTVDDHRSFVIDKIYTRLFLTYEGADQVGGS